MAVTSRSNARRLLGCVALLAALALTPAPAFGAACCVSASSFGVGRLLIWEDFAAGLRVGHSRVLGQYAPDGSYRGNAAGYAEGITALDPWAIVRLHRRLQWQAWMPFVVNDRASDGRSQVAGGLGDAGTALRVEILSIGELLWVPAVALTVGVVAPTGRRVEQTRPPLFAGTTGRGAWGGFLALEAEYALLPWFVRVEGAATGFLPFTRSDTGQRERYGVQVQAAFSGGVEVMPDVLVAALALGTEWEDAFRLDGETVPGSSARALSLSASLSWRMEPHWTLVGNVVNTVWTDGVGANRDGRVGVVVGVRYGYF